MSVRRAIFFVGAAISAGAVVVACSSSSDTSTSTLDGGTPSSGGGSGACSVNPGDYTVHYALDPSSTGYCITFPESDFTTSGSDGGGSVDGADAGASCQISQSGCTITTKCSMTLSEMTAESELVFTVTNGTPSGTLESKTSGSVTSHCKYAITYTKK